MRDVCTNCYGKVLFEMDDWDSFHCKICGEPLCATCMDALHGLCSDECKGQHEQNEQTKILITENEQLRKMLGKAIEGLLNLNEFNIIPDRYKPNVQSLARSCKDTLDNTCRKE